MRVAILSDTHGHLCPHVLEVVGTCELAVHAGDICGKHILDALHERVARVVAVAGNNDLPKLWAPEEAATVEALPRTVEIELPGGTLAVEHGHAHGWAAPDHAGLRAAHPGARMIVYGHTHKKVLDQSTSPWIVNPGAAGRTRTNGGPSCLVLHADESDWRIEKFRFKDRA
jgi:putative phosphoesterase